jgi:hypothetical protein
VFLEVVDAMQEQATSSLAASSLPSSSERSSSSALQLEIKEGRIFSLISVLLNRLLIWCACLISTFFDFCEMLKILFSLPMYDWLSS